MNQLSAIEEILPLSPVQAGMLLHCLDQSGPAGSYVGLLSFRIDGELDIPALRAAFDQTISARDALRVSFVWEGASRPLQPMHRRVKLPWTTIDLSDFDTDTQEGRIEELIRTERRRGFDLRQAPLMRVTLIKTGAQSHQLIWTIHHIIADGWSAGLLLDDVLRRYHSDAPHAPKHATFRDYLAWQNGRDIDAELGFWSRYLADAPDAARIPFAASPTGQQGGLHASADVKLDLATTKKLSARARDLRVTSATLLQTCWAMVLRRYSGSDAVMFGQTNSGRPPAIGGIQDAVGAFVNTLPVIVRFDEAEPIMELMRRAEAEEQSRRPHLFAPLGRVLDAAHLPRRDAPFDVLFVVQNMPSTAAPNTEIQVRELEVHGPSHYPLACVVYPGDETRIRCLYDPTRFGHDVLTRVADDYRRLLEHLAKASLSTPLGRFVQEALAQPDNAAPAFATVSRDKSVDELIAAQGRKEPETVAIDDGTTTLSYRDLNSRANGLAATLHADGIGPGDIVAIALPRGCDVVVAMLGILRSGAAYVPLDLDYPQARLNQILDICRPAAVISNAAGAVRPPEAGTTVLDLSAIASTDVAPTAVARRMDDLAYVCFTSGSQGKPKGVMVSHDNLAYSTLARDPVYGAPPKAFLMLSSFAFDSSVVGIYWTLCHGSTLTIAQPRAEQDLRGLGKLIGARSITHLLCLPNLYRLLLAQTASQLLRSLNTVIVAGEPLNEATIAAHRNAGHKTRLFNEYGPTEGTVWCTGYDTAQYQSATEVPIGKALAGSRVDVTDPDGMALPDGVVGELSLEGPGVAQGYLANEVATSGSFTTGPTGQRNYKTGDVGYRRPGDGMLVLRGRRDGQIKVRGHRVEVAEIESALQKVTAGREAVVVATEGGNPGIAAVVAGDAGAIQRDEWLEQLREMLPQYMVPSRLATTAVMPRLPNGKLDRQALRKQVAVETKGKSPDDAVPDGFVEESLAEIWQDVLSRKDIGRNQDFFTAGGDSLKSIAMVARADEVGLHILPHEIFDHPRLCDLADAIKARASRQSEPSSESFLTIHHADAPARPFFMVHGSPRMCSALAQSLGPDRPLAFLYSHYLRGEATGALTIPDMAEVALGHLRTLQSNGGYLLGGYSFGAIIAAEMARQLHAVGQTIDALVLLDPPPVGRPDPYRNLGRRLRLLTTRRLRMSGLVTSEESRLSTIRDSYSLALTTHHLPPCPVTADIFTSEDLSEDAASADWRARTFPQSSNTAFPFRHNALQTSPDALVRWATLVSLRLRDVETPQT